jgi:hypothetical protein
VKEPCTKAKDYVRSNISMNIFIIEKFALAVYGPGIGIYVHGGGCCYLMVISRHHKNAQNP